MALQNFHTHTIYSDGKNTPEEMLAAAAANGMSALGFSDHSYTAFDPDYCMAKERIDAYKAHIRKLQQTSQIRVYLGIEQDYLSDIPAVGYDYVIGSVHYVSAGENIISVDNTPEILREGVDRCFGGDFYALAERYWEMEADVVARTGADIIGHLDVIRKFNRDGVFFDEAHPRYRKAAAAAVDALLKTGRPFEINTGGMSSGRLDSPYPSAWLIAYIQAHGGRFILSSDAHQAGNICYHFADYADLASTWEPSAENN